MKETNILKETMMEASRLGLVVFRNNTGELQDKTGRWVQFGLCKGSADLIGWIRDTGEFVAIECKAATGKVRLDQQQFLDAVSKSGGFSCVIRDAKNLKTHLDEYKRTRHNNQTTATKED